MSYILDALRKSESERRQGQVPDLGQPIQIIHKRRKRGIPAAVWIAVALLINAGVLAWLFWPDSRNSAPQGNSGSVVRAEPEVQRPAAAISAQTSDRSSEQASDQISDQASARANQSMTQTPADSAQSRDARAEFNAESEVPAAIQRNSPTSSAQDYPETEEGTVIRPSSQSRNTAGDTIYPNSQRDNQSMTGNGMKSEENLPPPTVIVPSGPVSAYQGAPGEVDWSSVPHLLEMSRDFQRRVPSLTFNSHVYASNPASRSVMINGKYLKVGDRVSGLKVDYITEDGVVLSLNGERFRVGVVRDWVSPR